MRAISDNERVARAMGELLDRWEMMNNDLRSDIKKQDFNFYEGIQDLYRAVTGIAPTIAPEKPGDRTLQATEQMRNKR